MVWLEDFNSVIKFEGNIFYLIFNYYKNINKGNFFFDFLQI